MAEKVYCYRGLDNKGCSSFGKLIASSQEDAEKKVVDFGIKADAVYEDGNPPPPETIKAIRELASKSAEKAQVAPTPEIQKPPPPSQVRGISPEAMAEIEKEKAKQLEKKHEVVVPTEPKKDFETLLRGNTAPPPVLGGRREELLCGTYREIKERLEVLLDKYRGTIKAVQAINTNTGHPYLSVVVEYERSKK